MVDEPVVTATPAPAVETAPVVATEVSPAVETVPEAPVVETPAAAPAVEPAIPEAPVENVLGAEPAKADAPKTEAKPDAAAPEKKDGETAPAVAAEEVKVELPAYEDFKLPENIQLEKEPLDAFTKILGEIETGKLDHKGMQEKGQALIDLAAKSTLDSINRLNDSYVQIHQGNVKARVTALKADPVMGGENFEDTMTMLQSTVAEYGGTEQQIADFRKEVTESGLGASPAVCRLIYNMQQKIDKYTKETSGNIVPGQKPAPTKVKPYQQFYQGNG